MAARDPAYRFLVKALVEGRKRAGLKQVSVAENLGKMQSYVSKVELCERRLDVIEFVRFAEAVGLDPFRVLRDALRKTK
jgi:transcriptional regulator with XRE-family HTH domain